MKLDSSSQAQTMSTEEIKPLMKQESKAVPQFSSRLREQQRILNEIPPVPQSEEQIQKMEQALAKLAAVFAEMKAHGFELPQSKELISNLEKYIAWARLGSEESDDED